jgi:hypothetical protein
VNFSHIPKFRILGCDNAYLSSWILACYPVIVFLIQGNGIQIKSFEYF